MSRRAVRPGRFATLAVLGSPPGGATSPRPSPHGYAAEQRDELAVLALAGRDRGLADWDCATSGDSGVPTAM